MKIIILSLFFLLQIGFTQDIFYDFTSEAFINIKRIIPYNNYLFVLNETKKICFSKCLKRDGTITKIIIKEGKGPKELVNPMDMDIINNKILIIDRYGYFFIYNIETETLSEKKYINFGKKLGNIYKVNFINENKILISFYLFSSRNLNIENKIVKHWAIYDIKNKKLTKIGIPVENFAKLKKTNTIVFFTHGVFDNILILTFKGADNLFFYNLKYKKLLKKIKIEHRNYFFFKEVENKIYGKGIKTASTFVDKGMKYKNKIFFLSGGVEPINPTLIVVDKNFEVSKIDLNLVEYFSGNLSLNGYIKNGLLYYWNNWVLIPKVSASFATKKIEFR